MPGPSTFPARNSTSVGSLQESDPIGISSQLPFRRSLRLSFVNLTMFANDCVWTTFGVGVGAAVIFGGAGVLVAVAACLGIDVGIGGGVGDGVVFGTDTVFG